MASLLLDEMIGPRVAAGLRHRGIDMYGVVERPDLRSLPDELVLALGAAEHRVVVTLNTADFVRLDRAWKAEGREHAGIVMVPDASFPQDRALVGALVSSLSAAADTGTLPEPDAVLYLQRYVD